MDMSGHAIGGVLSQEQEGKWKPIAFLSRTMQPAERNYEIYNKGLLAIVEALSKWRQYLLDAAETFEIWTDHEKPEVLSRTLQVKRTTGQIVLKVARL